MILEDELRMKPITNPYHRASLNVIFSGAWLSDRINQTLKPFGISEQQYNILRILRGQKGNPINLQDISERMVHKMSNTTRLIEKMRVNGLVERVICEHNRRKVEITILPKGLQLVESAMKSMKGFEDQFHRRLSEVEAGQLAQLLDKLRD
jgi:DNA-binding MarR family transcriptional regulator